MEPDLAIEAIVRRRSARLEKFFPRMIGCRVVVEAPHHRHRTGNLYHVRVDATVPGKELVVRRDPREHESHADVRVAIRDAFDATRRELMDEARRRRGQVKAHGGTVYGRVAMLDAEDGYGFLLTRDGREIYFHANSVLDGFDQLTVGSRVRFAEETGEQGPQASTVAIAGRRERSLMPPRP
jgi:cold shock CspA family protein/ribosome-associated translation inhibitor RaiA